MPTYVCVCVYFRVLENKFKNVVYLNNNRQKRRNLQKALIALQIAVTSIRYWHLLALF